MKVDKTKWKKCKLEDLCTNESSNIVISKVEIGRGNYSLFGASGLIGNINFYQQERPYLGIVKDGSGVGRVAKYPSFTPLVGTMQYILPKENVDIDYLHYLLVSLHLDKYVKGAAIPHIYFRHYKLEKTYLPPLLDQQTIATELDSIQTVIDGYKAQLADLDALAQSIFLDMFGDVAINNKSWDIIPMGQLGDFKNGLNYNKGEKGKTLKIIGVGDFQNLKAITLFDNIPSIEVESISQEYLLQNEDIVFVRSNGNKNLVGRCLEVYPNKEEVTFSGFCIRFRKSTDIVNKYLVALLTDTSFKKTHILKSNGIGIQNINQKLLGNLPIPVPPIDLQKRFAMQVKTIERQKELIRQQLAAAEQLMAERMQYYFS